MRTCTGRSHEFRAPGSPSCHRGYVQITSTELTLASLGVAAASVAATIVVSVMSGRNVRQQFIREQKIKVYEDLLAAFKPVRFGPSIYDDPALHEALVEIDSRIALYGSRSAYRAFQEFYSAIEGVQRDGEATGGKTVTVGAATTMLYAWEKLNRRLRKDLGVPGWSGPRSPVPRWWWRFTIRWDRRKAGLDNEPIGYVIRWWWRSRQ